MDVFKEVFTTQGRLNRRMHAKYQMIWTTLIILATITSSLITEFLTDVPDNEWKQTIGGVLSLIWLVGFFTIMTRRLHDLNKSGWFNLVAFVPLIGVFFWLYIFCGKGQVGANKYGEEPSDFEN